MKKKLLAAALAVILVCASIAGTVAYLTEKNEGESLVNTFSSSDGLIEDPEEPFNPEDPDYDDNGFFLLETDPETEELTHEGVEYTVVPGVDLAKDAFVRINGKTEVKSYLFIEVVDDLQTDLTATVDTTNWTATTIDPIHKVDGATTTVYVYKNGEIVDSDVADVHILADDKVTVAGTYDINSDSGSLTFYGYLCQSASFTDYTAAFNACFGE